MLSTKNNNTITDRKAIINKLKEKHNKLFKLENLETAPRFIPKYVFTPKNGDERVISLFFSEISSGDDVYTEFVSIGLEPEDPERRLWKWPYNPEFATEYALTEPNINGHRLYMIPVAELIDVAALHLGVKKESKPTIVEQATAQLSLAIEEEKQATITADIIGDAPLDQMTIRDKAAIDWKIPVSDKPWLNELITKHFTK